MNRRLPLLLLLSACQGAWSLDDLDGDGLTLLEGDCDDLDAAVSPEATEVCDGIDNDCDGVTDGETAEGARTFYADEDADGFGSTTRTVVACEAPVGFILEGGDCDDALDTVAPGADELCDDRDNDCDGEIDEEPVDGETFYVDDDDDGWGNPARAVVACTQPVGTVAADRVGDCHDDLATAYPGSRETEVPKDGIDQDCDGLDRCTDFTCDGLPDLVIGTYREDGDTVTEVRVFPGNEARTFDSVPRERLASDTVLGLSAHDLNDDGYLDLAWVSGDNVGVGGATVAFGGPDGLTVDDRRDLEAYRPESFRVADLDGDGDLDLVVASNRARAGGPFRTESFVYVNDGLGRFTPTRLPTEGAVDVEIADLDDDGWDDLVFCGFRADPPAPSFGGRSVVFWSGVGGADFSERRVTELPVTGCADVSIGDADGDDLPDLFFASPRQPDGTAAAESLILVNDLARFSSPDVVRVPVTAASSVAVGDLDGDGLDDAVYGYDGRVRQVWEGASSVVFAGTEVAVVSATLDSVDPRNPALGDVDDDGDLDVLVPAFGVFFGTDQTEPTRTWLNDGGALIAGPVLPTDGSWRVVATDADGDGHNDLITVNAGEGDARGPQAAIWYQRDGAFSVEDRWTVRMGKIRTPPVIVGSWPEG